MTIYFYLEREKPYGCFSNFAPYGFVLDHRYWLTSEHYFQAQKFVGTPYFEQVRQAPTPKDAANLGRDRSLPLRPDWDNVKDAVMWRAVLCKFQTHAKIREILLATNSALLVENAPHDYYWGCGADGSGQNRLGQILVAVREHLRHGSTSEAHSSADPLPTPRYTRGLGHLAQ